MFFSRNDFKNLSFICFFRFLIQFPVHVKAWRALKNSPKFYFFRPALLWHELKIILYLNNYLDFKNIFSFFRITSQGGGRIPLFGGAAKQK